MDFAPIPPCYLYPSPPPDHSKIGHCSQIQPKRLPWIGPTLGLHVGGRFSGVWPCLKGRPFYLAGISVK